MKRKGTRIVLPILILLSIFCISALILIYIYQEKELLVISHESGIYQESFELKVDSVMPGTIYYTTNGLRPDPQSESTYIYEGPLKIEMKDATSIYSFKFCCVFFDGTVSDIYQRDYILDEKGIGRFATKYVVSVTGTDDDLLGYERGLFVRGKQFDDYMVANPDVDLLNTVVPANYFSDSEVQVQAAIFNEDGTQLINQTCGLKIYGNVTRAKNQHSFRLIARYNYDGGVNEFSYEFLPKLISSESGKTIDAFQRLSFHSAGNDNGYGFIRTELIGELARQMGYPDVLVSESATVYVNGQYMGVYWLENTYDDRYFKEKYGNYTGEMVVCEGTLSSMDEANAENEAELQYCAEYNEFCNWMKKADMQDEQDWLRVCETIDIENFAKYMALEYYIGNIDWPHNNVKVYRYQGVEGEEYRPGTVFDGKYRYLLFDTDYGMGLKFLGWFGSDETDRRLADLCSGSNSATLFSRLLQRGEFRDLFVNSVMCLMYQSFSEQNVTATLEEYNQKRYDELFYMLEETDLMENSMWETEPITIERVHQEMQEIIQFAANRPDTVISELQEQWNCGATVEFQIFNTIRGNLFVNGMQINGDYLGKCFENIPVTINCAAGPGEMITGYYVNSEFIEGESITIIPGESLIGEPRLAVEPVYILTEETSLEIAEYYIRGSEDYVVIRNNGQTVLNLSDYAVVDEEDKLTKGRLPEILLAPNETFTVYGKEYSGQMHENSMKVPFAWSTEEPIMLIHISDGVVEIRNAGMQN